MPFQLCLKFENPCCFKQYRAAMTSTTPPRQPSFGRRLGAKWKVESLAITIVEPEYAKLSKY